MVCSIEEWKPAIAMLTFDISYAVMTGLVKKAMDEGMNPLIIITLRQLVGAIFLSPIAFFKERKTRPKLTSKVSMYIFLSAILGATLVQYLFFVGMQYTTATFGSTFTNLYPVTTFLLALLLRVESVNIKSKTGMAKVTGTLLSLIGAMVLTLYKGVPLTHKTTHLTRSLHNTKVGPNSSTERWMLGSIALLANVLTFSSWMLLQSKITKLYPVVYSGTALMSFFSFLQAAAISMAVERSTSAFLPTGKVQIITVLYTGVVSSGIAFVLLTWAVQKRGAVFTSSFLPLIQVFVAFIDVVFLHEPLYFGSILGSILLIIGLYVLLWGKKKEACIRTEELPEINQLPQENK